MKKKHVYNSVLFTIPLFSLILYFKLKPLFIFHTKKPNALYTQEKRKISYSRTS